MKSDELHLNFAGGVFGAVAVAGYARYSNSMSESVSEHSFTSVGRI